MPQSAQNLPIPSKPPHVLMMAAGTGGHVFPALAVAEELTKRGAVVHWLGTPAGMENDLVKPVGYAFHPIEMQGLRGKGMGRLLKMPFTLMGAIGQARRIIKEHQIDVVVGFGGYVTAPGGLAAKLSGIPLIIHEQNAIAGMSNRYLAKMATKVLQAFDHTFNNTLGDSSKSPNAKLKTVGNPVREAITQIDPPEVRYDADDDSPLKVLVVGGSLGAQVLNETVPKALALLDKPVHIHHQCGKNNGEATQKNYDVLSMSAHAISVMPFITDMASEYAWADVIICRAGALTVTEIQNVGLAAIFVPLPHAVDDHQTANARYLADANAAYLLPQSQLNPEYLAEVLSSLTRADCREMAIKGKEQANPGSTVMVADVVWDVLRK